MFSIDTTSMGKPDNGILYVLLVHLEGRNLVKIGITTSKIDERVSGLVRSIWTRYRYFPYVLPKRFKVTTEVRSKEALLHSYFKEYGYRTKHKFGGHTEMFDIPLLQVVAAYEYLLEHGTLDNYDEVTWKN